MEISFRQVETELYPLSNEAKELKKRLAQEEADLRLMIIDTRCYFSEDKAMMHLIVDLLTQAIDEVRKASLELDHIDHAVYEFVRVLTK